MPNIAYNLIATVPTLESDGHWWWTLRTHRVNRHGPFTTEAEAVQHREHRFLHLKRRARAVGGWGWRSTHTRWHVLLPEAVACNAPKMDNKACSHHLPLPEGPAGETQKEPVSKRSDQGVRTPAVRP